MSLVILFTCTSKSFSDEYRIGPESDLEKLCANVEAGDSVILRNGVWENVVLEFDSLPGTEKAPVLIVAETPGKVVLTGKTNVRVSGQHVTVSGLIFRDCFDVNHVLEMKTKQGHAHHSRVTECVFEQPTKANSKHNTKWLSVYGTNNRIDHCYFDGKTTLGTTLVVWVNETPGRHRIDHNHFGPRPKLGQNGGETIRIGTSKVSELVCQTIVEDNYFFHCDGEAEIISNKSCENIYRHNVFEECAGALTLRHGHRCIVDANVFLGNKLPQTGGVRIIGEGHRVTNNYFGELRGDSVRAAICLMNGIPDGPLNGYAPVKNAIIANNTLVDCLVSVEIGTGAGSRNRTVAPEECLFANNVFSSRESNSIRFLANPRGFTWRGNKQQIGRDDANQPIKFDRVKLKLQKSDDAVMRPTDPKPLRTDSLDEIEVSKDIDGELRGKTPIAGCDDPRTSQRKLASPANTGPKWWGISKPRQTTGRHFHPDS